MKKKFIIIPLILLVLCASFGSTYYFYQQYQKIKKNPELIGKEEIKSTVNTIKRFMDLPSDEEPTLVTVADKEKLKDQEFFKNAQNGDKILIYTKARKALLFRPSTGRIIEFAPLIIGAQDQTAQPTTAPEPVKVILYNGTKTAGLTSEYEKKLSGIQGIAITDKTNAKKNDYTKTSVIDLSGTHKELAADVAKQVGGDVVTAVPEGETKPEADILIIIGK